MCVMLCLYGACYCVFLWCKMCLCFVIVHVCLSCVYIFDSIHLQMDENCKHLLERSSIQEKSSIIKAVGIKVFARNNSVS